MSRTVRSRLAVLVAVFAVLAATLVPALPAVSAAPIDMGSADPQVTKSVAGTFPAAQVLTLTAAYPPGVVIETGVTYKYQWYRYNSNTLATVGAISGAAHASYKLTTADYPYLIAARVTVSKTGRTSVTRYSLAKDYSLRNVFAFTIAGDPTVGSLIDAGTTAYFQAQDPSPTSQSTPEVFPSPGVTEWLRSGSSVVDHGTTYEVRVADLGKQITARITVAIDGYLSYHKTSPAVKGTLGILGGSTWSPSVVQDEVTMLLTASVPSDMTAAPFASHDSAPPSKNWQWYRNGVAVPGKVASTYQLTPADYGKSVSVHIIWKKTGYFTNDFESSPVDYSVRPDGPVSVTGDPAVDGTLSADDGRAYVDPRGNSPVTPAQTYQWYRNGIAITSNGSDREYTLGAADKGKTITVTITAHYAGLLDSVGTSAPTQTIGTHSLEPLGSPATVALDSTTTTTKTVLHASTGLTGPAPLTVTYQWYRDTAKIGGATKVTYPLTTSDIGHQIWVRVVTGKKAVGATTWTTSVKDSVKHNYSITVGAGGAIDVPGSLTVDQTILQDVPAYSSVDGPISSGDLTHTYQWLRNGVAIPSTVARPSNEFGYVLQAADVGAKISVRVTTAKTGGGLIPVVQVLTTVPATQVVAKADFTGLATTTPTIVGAGVGKLTVTVSAGLSPAAASYTYRWYRDDVAITKATGATYALTAADAQKTITVRLTPVRAGYNSVALPISAGWNPSIYPSGVPSISVVDNLQLGHTLGVDLPAYNLSDGVTPAGATPAYQWYRNGVAIGGATQTTYTLATADYNTLITVKVTASASGFRSVSATTASVGPIQKGESAVGLAAMFVTDGDVLRASITPGTLTPATPAPQIAYRWMRGDTAITGANTATYTPVAADACSLLSVKLTITRPNFVNSPTTVQSPSQILCVTTEGGVPNISATGNGAVGVEMGVVHPSYEDYIGAHIAPHFDYQWYRDAVPIAGETHQTFTPKAADAGAVITVRVMASVPGLAPYVYTTPVGVGPIALASLGSISWTTPMTNVATRTLTATITGVIPAGVTTTYQWYRKDATVGTHDWIAITGKTTATYQLTSADFQHSVSVLITVKKAGYQSFTPTISAMPAGTNWSILPDGSAMIDNTEPIVGDVLTAQFTSQYFDQAGGGYIAPDSYTYKWTRGGVVVASVTGATYPVTTADRGKLITVVMTPFKAGRLSVSLPAVSTTAPVPQALAGSKVKPGVTKGSTTATLTATLTPGSITTPGVTLLYQWLKDGSPIVSAEDSTYSPTQPDWNHVLSVRISAHKSGYDTVVLPDSSGINPSLVGVGLPTIDNATPQVGDVLTAIDTTYRLGGASGSAFVPSPGSQDIVWYLDGGDPHYGATLGVVAGMEGKVITLMIHTPKTGWLEPYLTSVATAPVDD